MAERWERAMGTSAAAAVAPPRARRQFGGTPPPPPAGPDGQGGGGGGGNPWLPPRPPWHRRRGILLGAGVVAVIATTVVVDLPQKTTTASDTRQEATVIASINTDLAQCAFAVSEGFKIFKAAQSPSLSAANRARIPALLTDDVAACSFTNQSTFDLANIEVPGTAAGRKIADAVATLSIWTTSDALGALTEIDKLTTDHPPRGIAAKERRELLTFERYAASDRAKVLADVAAASRDVKHTLKPPTIPVMPIGA